MGSEKQNIAVVYGNRKMQSNAGQTTIFDGLAYSLKVHEITIISAFKDETGKAINLGWENLELAAGQQIWFGCNIKEIDISTGGKGEYFLAEVGQATMLNPFQPPDNAVVTTLTGDYIVSVDGKYILTVDGFIPLNAMRTLTGEPVVTINNEYITI